MHQEIGDGQLTRLQSQAQVGEPQRERTCPSEERRQAIVFIEDEATVLNIQDQNS